MNSASEAPSSSLRTVRGLAIPGGLVHAHIHLDKCHLLSKTPIRDGSFEEALSQTSEVFVPQLHPYCKAGFTVDDLVERGRRLIQQSLQFGVQAMRCHVEVDPTVGLKCLHAGKLLQNEFAQLCDLQIVAFAQDPLLYPYDERRQSKMLELLVEACQHDAVAVLGSAPYVEGPLHKGDSDNQAAQRANIGIMFDLAQQYNKQLDFHLDYNLDAGTPPMLWFVLEEAVRREWSRGLMIGHATRISLFQQVDFARLQRLCQDVPRVSFVALPTSDLYMQGRESAYSQRTRATMPLLELIRRDIVVALSVNNVGNLFTPQGDGDPLALLPLVVALWQSARPDDLESILAMISYSARDAIGLPSSSPPNYLPRVVEVEVDEHNGLVRCLSENDCGSSYTLLPNCDSVQEAVLAPHAARLTVRQGRLIAWRYVSEGVSSLPRSSVFANGESDQQHARKDRVSIVATSDV